MGEENKERPTGGVLGSDVPLESLLARNFKDCESAYSPHHSEREDRLLVGMVMTGLCVAAKGHTDFEAAAALLHARGCPRRTAAMIKRRFPYAATNYRRRLCPLKGWAPEEERRLRELVPGVQPSDAVVEGALLTMWEEGFPVRNLRVVQHKLVGLGAGELFTSGVLATFQPWTPEEERALGALASTCCRSVDGAPDFELLVYELRTRGFPERTAAALRRRYFLKVEERMRRGRPFPWTPEEERRLLELVGASGRPDVLVPTAVLREVVKRLAEEGFPAREVGAARLRLRNLVLVEKAAIRLLKTVTPKETEEMTEIKNTSGEATGETSEQSASSTTETVSQPIDKLSSSVSAIDHLERQKRGGGRFYWSGREFDLLMDLAAAQQKMYGALNFAELARELHARGFSERTRRAVARKYADEIEKTKTMGPRGERKSTSAIKWTPRETQRFLELAQPLDRPGEAVDKALRAMRQEGFPARSRKALLKRLARLKAEGVAGAAPTVVETKTREEALLPAKDARGLLAALADELGMTPEEVRTRLAERSLERLAKELGR